MKINGESFLGEGAFSKVIKVRHKKTGRCYALKQITLAKLLEQDQQNLRSEILIHSQLRHRYIIRFVDHFQLGGTVYLVLEYASNGCLFFYIDAHQGLPERLALRFVYQAAQALRFIHRRGLIHRDIKPENIILDSQFNVKLCDFGWACEVGGSGFRRSICGTYEYMSPEVVNSERYDSKIDIWCLGVLLYEILHGTPPFDASSIDEVRRRLGDGIRVAKHFEPETRDLMHRLLEFDQSKRISIDRVLLHPAFLKRLKVIRQPLSEQDRALMRANYLKNVDPNSKRNLPLEIQNFNKRKQAQKLKKQISHSTLNQSSFLFKSKAVEVKSKTREAPGPKKPMLAKKRRDKSNQFRR